MTRSMTRWALAGCMALAAVGAAAVIDVGTATAEAAPSVSPFAGTYVGRDPVGWYPSWDITISAGGRIESSFSGEGRHKGSMRGQVGADGSYSLTVSTTYYVGKDPSGREGTKTGWATSSYTRAGSMALNADGNVVGSAGVWGTFTWFRQ